MLYLVGQDPCNSTKSNELIRDDITKYSKVAFAFLAVWCLAAIWQGVHTFLLLYKKGRTKNWDLVIFYFYAMLTLLCKAFTMFILE
jgi:hypothetical protein